MIHTQPAEIRFCCPSCGRNHRSTREHGGTVILCMGCGEMVRVPRQIPVQETRPTDASLLSPVATRRTLEGVRLLTIALGLSVLQASFVLAVYSLWIGLVGAPKLWAREAGDYRNLFFALWAVDLVWLGALSGYKWLGYQRCELAADSLNCLTPLTIARFSVLLRALGYFLAAIPWLTTNSVDATPWSLRAAIQLGHVLWVIGVVSEYAILLVWSKLFQESAAGLEKQITRYLAWLAGLSLTACSAFSVVGMTILSQLRRQMADQGSPAKSVARIPFEELPASGWWLLLGLAGFISCLALWSAWQYAAILRSLRQNLRKTTPAA